MMGCKRDGLMGFPKRTSGQGAMFIPPMLLLSVFNFVCVHTCC